MNMNIRLRGGNTLAAHSVTRGVRIVMLKHNLPMLKHNLRA
jgi:hypothetical protein